MEAAISREKQRVCAIAEEYRSKGYEVIEQPSPEQLPEFLTGYRPDLLVRRGDEATIVEVRSRSSLAKDPQTRELAQLLQVIPHWNFELVVVGEGEEFSTPEGARPFNRDHIFTGC
jgi:Holliday junction resolvase-like predicted endonuclease